MTRYIATRRGQRRGFSAEPDSPYLAVLAASGWTITAIQGSTHECAVKPIPDPPAGEKRKYL
jgi:hypothetical protein